MITITKGADAPILIPKTNSKILNTMSTIRQITSGEVFQAINPHLGIAVPSTATNVAISVSNDGITWDSVSSYTSGSAAIKCIPGQYFAVTFGTVSTLNVLM